MIRIGLIGPPEREELARLALRLEERSAQGVLLDPGAGPGGTPGVRLGPDGAQACGVDLTGFRGFYVADLGLPATVVRGSDGTVDAARSADARARSRRTLAAWNALLEHLARDVPVINPPRTHELHGLKPYEMETYRRAGLDVPLTVATTDPEVLADPGASPARGWVQKGLVGGYGYTELFEPGARCRSRRGAAAVATMIQERVQGDNVRAYVVAGAVTGAAAVIPRDGGEVDSRRGTGRVELVRLPPEAEQTALAAARAWGMTFCAVDFMRDAATGAYRLLECNSAPFFVEFERRTGLDLSSRLADALMGRRFGGY